MYFSLNNTPHLHLHSEHLAGALIQFLSKMHHYKNRPESENTRSFFLFVCFQTWETFLVGAGDSVYRRPQWLQPCLIVQHFISEAPPDIIAPVTFSSPDQIRKSDAVTSQVQKTTIHLFNTYINMKVTYMHTHLMVLTNYGCSNVYGVLRIMGLFTLTKAALWIGEQDSGVMVFSAGFSS